MLGKSGAKLLIKIRLETLEKAVDYREKMRRYLYWSVR